MVHDRVTLRGSGSADDPCLGSVVATADAGRDPLDASRTAMNTDERDLIHAYWRAANYLAVGQIYLYDNPLLR